LPIDGTTQPIEYRETIEDARTLSVTVAEDARERTFSRVVIETP
jgi:hypothetical protein